jgi:hypothetical protein
MSGTNFFRPVVDAILDDLEQTEKSKYEEIRQSQHLSERIGKDIIDIIVENSKHTNIHVFTSADEYNDATRNSQPDNAYVLVDHDKFKFVTLGVTGRGATRYDFDDNKRNEQNVKYGLGLVYERIMNDRNADVVRRCLAFVTALFSTPVNAAAIGDFPIHTNDWVVYMLVSKNAMRLNLFATPFKRWSDDDDDVIAYGIDDVTSITCFHKGERCFCLYKHNIRDPSVRIVRKFGREECIRVTDRDEVFIPTHLLFVSMKPDMINEMGNNSHLPVAISTDDAKARGCNL